MQQTKVFENRKEQFAYHAAALAANRGFGSGSKHDDDESSTMSEPITLGFALALRPLPTFVVADWRQTKNVPALARRAVKSGEEGCF